MNIEISNVESSDYDLVINKVNEWWGGRDMQNMLQCLLIFANAWVQITLMFGIHLS